MSLGRGQNFASRIIRSVELLVCNCVNEALRTCGMSRYGDVQVSELFTGITNIPIPRRMARSALFMVLHDKFGFSYSDLSDYSSLTSNSIMTAIRKYKNTPESDDIVRKVNELIEIELQKFPIV